MHRRLLPLLLLLTACPDPEIRDVGGGAGDAALTPDAPSPDAPDTDAGVERDAAEDAAASDATGTDAAASDAGSETPCDDPVTLSGVVYGGMAAERTVLPLSGAPAVVTRIEEAGDFVAGAASRMSPAGLAWHAQASHLTMFDSVNYEHFLPSPDGALYAGLEQQMQRDGTAFRFYHPDRTLAFELVRDGTPGLDILGAQRQSNFLLAKHLADGTVEWVSRFGPNRSGTDRAGGFVTVGLAPGGIRVLAQVENGTEIVLGPGRAGTFTYAAPGPISFWGELSPADGAYVSGSFRQIQVSGDGASNLTALGQSAHNGAETAFAGALVRASGTLTVSVGAGGPGALALTTTKSMSLVGKIAADGAPAFVATADVPALRNGLPEPRAVGLSPAGDVVVGGQLPGTPGEALFRGATGPSQRLTYESSNSYLAAHAPDGALRWVKRIVATNRNAVFRVLVTSDSVYLMQTLARGDVLDPGAPTEVTLPVSGYHLSAFSLATGDLRWVRSFTDRTGMSSPAAYEVWVTGADLVVPAAFAGATRVVGGGQDRVFTYPGAGVLAGFVLSANGDLLSCQPLAHGGQRFRALP